MVVFAGTATTVAVALNTAPRYAATALLLVKPLEAQALGFEAVVPGLTANLVTLDTHVRMLTSHALLAEVSKDLWRTAPMQLPPPDTGRRLSSLFSSLPLEDATLQDGPVEEAATEPGNDADLLPYLRDNLTVAQQGRSLVIGITFTSTDRDATAFVANAVAERFVAAQVEQKRAAIRGIREALGTRIAVLRAEVEDMDAAANSYREAWMLRVGRVNEIDSETVAYIERELLGSETDLRNRSLNIAFLRDLDRRAELLLLPERVNPNAPGQPPLGEGERPAAEAGAPSAGGGEESRQVAEPADGGLDSLIARLEGEQKTAEGRVAALRSVLEETRRLNAEARAAELQLQQPVRDADATRQLYEAVLRRFHEVREQEQLVVPDTEVISAAVVPDGPISPGAGLVGVLGFIVFSMLGVVLAMAVDLFSPHGGIGVRRATHRG